LLDEPTAHLDPETERDVLDALHRATVGSTVIVATHSAAVARSAGVVWSIDDGAIAVREQLAIA
jgi:ATP-binding cassette subfamily C protein CydD